MTNDLLAQYQCLLERCPELADVLREASESSVSVEAVFEGFAENIGEMLADYVRALADARREDVIGLYEEWRLMKCLLSYVQCGLNVNPESNRRYYVGSLSPELEEKDGD